MPEYEAYANGIATMISELKFLAAEPSSLGQEPLFCLSQLAANLPNTFINLTESQQRVDVIVRLCALSQICLDCADSLLSSGAQQLRRSPGPTAVTATLTDSE